MHVRQALYFLLQKESGCVSNGAVAISGNDLQLRTSHCQPEPPPIMHHTSRIMLLRPPPTGTTEDDPNAKHYCFFQNCRFYSIIPSPSPNTLFQLEASLSKVCFDQLFIPPNTIDHACD